MQVRVGVSEKGEGGEYNRILYYRIVAEVFKGSNFPCSK